MNRLKNKVAIVTGAAGGIGKAIAQLFAAEGAQLMVTDMQVGLLKSWVKEYEGAEQNMYCMQQDVRQEEGWLKLVEATIARFGRLDILVNNAGIFTAATTTENLSLADWQRTLDVNLTAAFLGARYCVPEMKKAGAGSIVHIASIAALVGGNGPAYSASKAGLCMLGKDQAVELAPYGIRVNSILPGGVLTPMTDFMVGTPGYDEMMKAICPLGRIGRPEEIAYAALYLASDEAAYTTGTELVVDGGLTAR